MTLSSSFQRDLNYSLYEVRVLLTTGSRETRASVNLLSDGLRVGRAIWREAEENVAAVYLIETRSGWVAARWAEKP